MTLRVRSLSTEQWLLRPIDEVFAFFSDAGNLDVLTPPWLHFRVLTALDRPIGQGTLIDYRLRWRGVPLWWRTEIILWQPPYRFVDRQVKGPYRQWHHEHTFEPHGGGTLMCDRIDYIVPGWLLEPLLTRLVVAGDVERIFAYRRERMEEMFGTVE
jgi:ligand-binding SRPBCC domain-containing protein